MLKQKSYQEINEKLKQGKVIILTAEEATDMARKASPAGIAEKVDVVTTATYGAMCSSGAIINFGHAEPPIRMEKIRLNGVPCCEELAAVDGYIGATACDPEKPEYGSRWPGGSPGDGPCFCESRDRSHGGSSRSLCRSAGEAILKNF